MTHLRISLVALTLASIAVTRFAAAQTPVQYCEEHTKNKCEVLNIEILPSGSFTGNMGATLNYKNGDKIPLSGQSVADGNIKIDVYGEVPMGNKYVHFVKGTFTVNAAGCSASGTEDQTSRNHSNYALSCKSAAEWYPYMGSGKLPASETTIYSCQSNNYPTTPIKGSAVCASATCSLNPSGSLGTVMVAKKVCDHGKYRVIFKQQVITAEKRAIEQNDCSE